MGVSVNTKQPQNSGRASCVDSPQTFVLRKKSRVARSVYGVFLEKSRVQEFVAKSMNDLAILYNFGSKVLAGYRAQAPARAAKPDLASLTQ